MEIRHLSPEDAIKKKYIPFYNKGMGFFYHELVLLNTNIFILDHVLGFPYHLFTFSGELLFFRMVFENFFNASLLIITKLATDQGSDPFTLTRFRNRIQTYIRKRYRDAFNKELDRVKFDSVTRDLLKRARDLRVERVAHADEEVVLGQAEGAKVSFGELKILRDRLVEILDAISFNNYYMMLPFQYSPTVQHPIGTDAKPDIEKLLDYVAQNSLLLNAPESDPNGWSWRKQLLSKKDLSLFNSYRKKFGLPDA